MVDPIFKAPTPPPLPEHNQNQIVQEGDAENHNQETLPDSPMTQSVEVSQQVQSIETPQQENTTTTSQREQALKRLNELKESFIRYFWYSISGLFLLGMFFGCAMFGGDNGTPQKLPQKAITRIITNRQIQRRLPICGTALLSEPCVFYVLNYSTTDHKPEDYYSYIANAMQRPPNSIKTENILYNNELIKPGYFAEIIVPVKR
ncbi:MAG: hypothetical protein E7021_02580 [Alphaproteobacteria bacterium]|nr:hypothetical protein [Alphaproteobacteria bacterium]